jgi:hypothetical protein
VLGVRLPGGRRVVGRVVEDPLRDQPDQADDRGAVVAVQREVEREHVVAEDALADGQRLVEVGALVVESGHRHRPGHADGRALLPERRGGRVHPVDRRDDEKRRISGAQPGP